MSKEAVSTKVIEARLELASLKVGRAAAMITNLSLAKQDAGVWIADQEVWIKRRDEAVELSRLRGEASVKAVGITTQAYVIDRFTQPEFDSYPLSLEI